MNDTTGPFLLFFLTLLIIFGISSSSKVNLGFRYIGLPPMRREYKDILRSYCRFYRELPVEKKSEFEKRVQYFIKSKIFIARGFDQVTGEMKVLISATAIQLTYGFPNVYLSHFSRILIYPDNYYSTINKLYHQGEVNPLNKIIVLSWKSFMRGMIEDQDGVNLGLHEMAHAIRLENMIRNSEYDFLDRSVLARWEALAKEEIEKLREDSLSIFRKYGGTSEDEFFAVAVENYFERPDLFKQYHPDLYETMSKLLNQNT